jgi:hypothetical protein
MRNQSITVNMDIESVLPWQDAILKSVSSGILPINLFGISSSRQTGKSMISSYYYSASKLRNVSVMGTNLCNEIFLPMAAQPKYKFTRSKWYEVNIWTSDEVKEILRWCAENFGSEPRNPDAWTRWYSTWNTVRFRDEQDYMLYQLRWA